MIIMNHPMFFIFLFSAFLLHYLRPITAANSSTSDENTEFIRTSCNTTLVPDLCVSTLSGYATTVNKNPNELAKIAIGLSITKAHDTAEYFSGIAEKLEISSDNNSTAAGLQRADDDEALQACFEALTDATGLMSDSLKKMGQIENVTNSNSLSRSGTAAATTNNIDSVKRDAVVLITAALASEGMCMDRFERVRDGDEQMKRDVGDHVQEVKGSTYIALGLAMNLMFKI